MTSVARRDCFTGTGSGVANAGHLSVAVDRERMFVNHFGPSFATMRPENVVFVDFSGRVLERIESENQ